MTGEVQETGPVRAAHRFPVEPLAAFLEARLGLRPPLAVLQMQGGQSNPTFLLTDAAGNEVVLRKQPPGELLPSAHAVDREFRVMAALHPTGFPVPRALLFSEDRGLVGTPFFVMERIKGRVFRANDLPGLSPEERQAIYQAMGDTLVRLHALDPAAVGLADFGRPGSYYARQIDRWTRQWQASRQGELPALERLIEWLPRHLPPDGDEGRICHGDFRLENLMFAEAEPRVRAVFDWELATLGPPLADLGYNCIPWEMADQALSGLRGRDLASLGIPNLAAYLARYREKAGRSDTLLPFHLAFAMFRLAVILEGVLARARQGNAASVQAEAMGALGRRFAERAWEIAREG